MPKRRPVTTAVPSVATSSRTSIAMSAIPGSVENCAGRTARSAVSAHIATSTPATPPMAETVTLSISICCTSRPRVAPTARRTDSSFCRPDARARSSVATFAHAISSTNPTAPSSTSSGVRTSPTSDSRSARDARAVVAVFGRVGL